MNKVITINLNGHAYQLEENAYETLRAYLENAGRKLAGNPDQAEIIADIEQAIGDKCRASLGAYRTVVSLPAIEMILAEMGPVDDGSAAGAAAAPSAGGAEAGARPEPAASGAAAGAAPGPAKRLYRLPEGAMISGVCNGLAAYFGRDVTLIRLLFVLVTFLTFGVGIGAYIVLEILMPRAQTPTEQAAAFGSPSTAQEFIRRAREGYYEGLKNFHDKQAHRAWKRRFKEDMRSWSRNFSEEMRANASRWQQQWAPPPGPGVPPGFFLAWPLFALVRVILTIGFLGVLLSLIFTGTVFGLALPGQMPLWVGIVVLVLVFNALIWPFRWHRSTWGYGYGCGGPHPFLGLAVAAVCLWLADRYVPHVHEMLLDLPPFLHRAADTLREWWNRH